MTPSVTMGTATPSERGEATSVAHRFGPAQVDQRISAIVESLRIVGAQRDGAVKARQRVFRPLERAQGIAAIVERFCEIGFE